jgi:hypothetical protein
MALDTMENTNGILSFKFSGSESHKKAEFSILILLMIIFLSWGFSSINSIKPLIIIFSFATIFFSYWLYRLLKMALEIKIDDENLYILFWKEYKIVTFSHIKQITYSASTMFGGFYTIKIKKKDNISKIAVSHFNYFATSQEDKERRKILLEELGKRTTVMKSKVF